MSTRLFSDIAVMRTLVKREFLEQRLLFVLLPLAVMLFIAGAFTVITMSILDPGPRPITVLEFASFPAPARGQLIHNMYSAINNVLIVSYWCAMLLYFLMTLYQQRKDKSILFWNSMPVSDAQTIVSKLLAGMIGAQAVVLASMLVLHLFLLLALLGYGAFHDIDGWQTFVTPYAWLTSLLALVPSMLVSSLWTLPIYGWLLLVSARARSIPFAWAIAPFAVVLGFEYLLAEDRPMSEAVFSHLFPFEFVDISHIARSPAGLRPLPLMMLQQAPWLELALSGVLGVALLYAAIRCNRSEES
ncbi:MAG: hypothetical protein V4603_09095 [Pseudomonadota bacterium]